MKKANSEEEKHLLSSMRAFLLAGVISWLNEHLEEIKDNPCNIESESKENGTENFLWFKLIIDACNNDLFDPRNIEYFKNETMIKNLELKIASSKCNSMNDKTEQRVLLTAVRCKDKKGKKVKTAIGASDNLQNNDTCGKKETDNKSLTNTSNKVEENDVPNQGSSEEVVSVDKDIDIEAQASVYDTGHEDRYDSNKKEMLSVNNGTNNEVKENEKSDETVAVINSQEINKDEAAVIVQENERESSVINNVKSLVYKNQNGDSLCLNSDTKNSKLDKCLETVICSQIEEKNMIPSSETLSDNLVKLEVTDNINSSKLSNKPHCSDSESQSQLTVKVVSKLDDKKKPSSSAAIVIEYNKNDDSRSLQELVVKKQKFEYEKVSVPNPLFAYFQLQNILTSLFKDDNPDFFETLSTKIQISL